MKTAEPYRQSRPPAARAPFLAIPNTAVMLALLVTVGTVGGASPLVDPAERPSNFQAIRSEKKLEERAKATKAELPRPEPFGLLPPDEDVSTKARQSKASKEQAPAAKTQKDRPPENKASTKKKAAPEPAPEPAPELIDTPTPLALTDSGMTLETLQALALHNNPSIQRAAALVCAAQGNRVQVGLPPNPSVGFDGQQIGSGGQAEQYGITIGQEIVRREKLRVNRAVAGHTVCRLSQELAAQKLRVLTDVRIAYYRMLRAQQQMEITSSLWQISQKAVVSSQALYQAEEVGKGDVLRAELERENANIMVQQAQQRFWAAWQQLCTVTANPGLEAEHLSGDLFGEGYDVQFEQTLFELQQESPEIKALLAEVDRARCYLVRQEIEPLPNITVNGLVNWRDNGIGGGPDGAIAVSVPLPLWNRNQGAIQQARCELAAAKRDVSRLELQLQERLIPIFERYSNAKMQSQLYRDRILPKSQEALDLVRRSYEEGELGFIDLLTAQRTYMEHWLSYIDSVESLRVAESEIEGMLLSGSLSRL